MKSNNTFQETAEQKQKAKRIYSWSNYYKAVTALLIYFNKPVLIVEPMDPPWNLNSIKLLTTIFNNDYTTSQINTTQFTAKLSEYLRQWAISLDITVNVEGKENLESLYHDQTQAPIVNLFLPSHRSPIPDAILMGHLDLPHYIVCGNPAMFNGMPDRLKRRLASIPEFVSVGPIKNEEGITTIEKLIKSLRSGISRNVVNYPQGFVPSAGEILPISKQFVDKLLAVLILNGFIVNIYPVAYEIESEFLFMRPTHKKMTYTIKYGKPLKFDTVKVLVQAQLGSVELKKKNLEGLINGSIHGDGPKYFDNYILTFWYETITKHKELNIEELNERAKIRFGLL